MSDSTLTTFPARHNAKSRDRLAIPVERERALIGESNRRRPLRTNSRERHRAGGTYATEMREVWADWKYEIKRVFTLTSPGQELLAGLTVAAVALPLNVALAISCGLPPSAGLLAGAIGGGIAALLGGASLQVSGPAAALNFMVLGVVTQFGVAGAAAAAIFVGLLELLFFFTLAGKLGRFIPEAVLAGFMSGVGLKLLDNQIPELLGFDYKVTELMQMIHRPTWLHDVSWLAVICGLAVALTVVSTRHWKRFPAGLVGVTLVTALSVYLDWKIERVGSVVATLDFGIPRINGSWLSLALVCLPLGFLAAVESLLSAQAVDRMSGVQKKHNPNLELFGQGVANLFSGFVQGMPVTGVIVRSSVNVQGGAKTRLSAMIHSAVLFFAVFFLTSQIARIPLAGLAGLLCVVGFRLVEVGTFVHLLKTHRWAALAFFVTAAGTVSGLFVEGLLLGLFIEGAHWFLTRKKRDASKAKDQHLTSGIRAVVPKEQAPKPSRTYEPMPNAMTWKSQIKERAHISHSAFVHPKASVIGKVVLGDNVHIAAGSSVRADEGSPFYIGDNSNIQDGVVVHALKERWVNIGGDKWAVYVGKSVSMAHQALVHGPCFVGDHTFIGFRAVVHDSVVGSHCYIGIGAVVIGVEVPHDRYVPHGTIVDTQEKANALPPVSEAHMHFNTDVVEVNRGLAYAYREQLLQSLAPERAGELSGHPLGRPQLTHQEAF